MNLMLLFRAGLKPGELGFDAVLVVDEQELAVEVVNI
jgi:hypothetical protein